LAAIQIKRVYLPLSPADGQRILVERLWPRGLTKAAAKIDCWLRDIAPSKELRTWFGHDPDKWMEFRRRYWRELKQNPEAVAAIMQMIEKGPVTLVYAAHDQVHNSAVALKEYLERSTWPPA